MRKALFALLAVGLMTAGVSTSAEAWGGCGPYRHPTPFGCRVNGWGGPGWVGLGYGWHRPWGGYGYGWHRGWHRHYW